MIAELFSRPSLFYCKLDPSSSLLHLGYSLEGRRECEDTQKKFFSKNNGGLHSESPLHGPPRTMQDKLDAKPGMGIDHFTGISRNKSERRLVKPSRLARLGVVDCIPVFTPSRPWLERCTDPSDTVLVPATGHLSS